MHLKMRRKIVIIKLCTDSSAAQNIIVEKGARDISMDHNLDAWLATGIPSVIPTSVLMYKLNSFPIKKEENMEKSKKGRMMRTRKADRAPCFVKKSILCYSTKKSTLFFPSFAVILVKTIYYKMRQEIAACWLLPAERREGEKSRQEEEENRSWATSKELWWCQC